MSQATQLPMTRSTSHWYADGNVILEVEQTQFRLHRSLLAKHFPIFADAFNFTGASDIEHVEQCSVLRLQGDTVADWENVLMAVFDPYLLYSTTADYPIPVLLSTLRLSVKYEADNVRGMAAACLQKLLPTTPAEYSQMARGILDRLPVPTFVEHIFEIIEIGFELGLHSILPAACLVCLRFRSMSEILNGYTREDKTTSCLSPSLSKKLILGWHAMLIEAMTLVVGRPMSVPIPKNCQPRRYLKFSNDEDDHDGEWLECTALERGRACAARTHRLAVNPAKAFESLGTIDLCDVCSERIQAKTLEGRQELWDLLPSFFGLPAWPQLRDFDS